MKIKDLIDRILYYVSVPKCVLCRDKLDFEDRGLCKKCMVTYAEHKGRNCSRCARILSECSCSSYYLASHGVKRLIKVFRYSKREASMPSNYLIYSLKQDKREDVISFLAEELSDAILNSIDTGKGDYVITNVPRRKRSIVHFGFDHAKVLAKRVSENLSIEYKELLVSRSKKSQKSVFGEERIKNARFDYKSKKDVRLKGKTVILVDDIVTTGASMSSCAMLLRGLGTRKIIGAVLGIAFKDSYTPPRKKYTAAK